MDSPQIRKLFNSRPQTIYAGFDPTADSLHIGNLLVMVGLLHCQRGGHQPVALLGGATGLIGDPSGRTTERTTLHDDQLQRNLTAIRAQIERVFANHAEHLWRERGALQPVRIVNNADWYAGLGLVDFVATTGRHFRMGSMLSRSSVQSRLHSDASSSSSSAAASSGMSFTEFTYQIFQAYDWLHLHREHNCHFQLGGSDQMGNLMSGHELISRVTAKPVYGLTLPIITNEQGNKFGKSAGNAVWLDEQRTSAFSLYQFFVRVADADVEQLLRLLTFVPTGELDALMVEHRQQPEVRSAQRRLATEVTLLLHGRDGLRRAEAISAALYTGSVEALAALSAADVRDSFDGATVAEVLHEPGMTMLQLAMRAGCFATESDAMRIMAAGGFYVNQARARNIEEVVVSSVHILRNGVSLLRVGKRNYYLVNWVQ